MAAVEGNRASTSHEKGELGKRKRVRIPKSCVPCLKGKRACDRERPACSRCTRSNQVSDCIYDSRLPGLASSSSSGRVVKPEYDSDDKEDSDRRNSYDSEQIDRLQSELQEARYEAQRLHLLLASQSHSGQASSAASHQSPPHINRPRTYSYSHDMHAARGLQMLAEIAGPTHQDASSNAGKAGVLNWSNRSVDASNSSSTQLSPDSASLTSTSNLPSSYHPSDFDKTVPTSQHWHVSSASPIRHAHVGRSCTVGDSASDSPKNINGTQIYYGDDPPGKQFLRRMTVGSTPTNTSGAESIQTGPSHGTSVGRDVQSAFNSLLDPSRDTFPFATIWSSGSDFFDEVLPFFPRQEEFDSICASFVRHFSAMCPALTIPTAINHARTFSRMSRDERSQVSLPWLAVFLMICALGKDCDLESASVGVDKKVRMLDAFLSGEASQQPSRASSPHPSIGETTSQSKPILPKSPARVSDLFLSAAYQALRLCSFLSSPTLQTIHSQLLIGSYLLNTERAASFWPLLGSVARQAQSIGLHVDPHKIKSDWDPVEADIRRRLWWAIVHQDVILSGIFGRPLGITRFSCKFPGSTDATNRTYATLQCEFSQFARTYLDENQDQSWSQQQVTDFTERVLQWYMGIPAQYRPDLGRLDLFGSETEAEVIQNYTAAGVDLNTKGLMEVHQSGNLAIEVFYILLSLHRSNILPSSRVEMRPDGPLDSAIRDDECDANTSSKVNEISLHICAQALRRITRAQQTMNDVLGRARGTMFWKIAYYAYQAAIAGAYIVFLRPQSKHAESALEDLAILTNYFDRMPERWNGLKTAKHGLRVLRTLAVAARENPKAASMPLKNSTSTTQATDSTAPLSEKPQSASHFANLETAQSSDRTDPSLVGPVPVMAGSTNTHHLLAPQGPSTPSSGSMYAHTSGVQSTFLPSLFNSFFLPSSNAGSPGGNVFASSSNPGTASSNVFGSVAAHTANSSPNGRGFSSTPLALFNNNYDLQENAAGSKAAFCYDPFIPETAVSSGGCTSSGKERDSSHSSTTPITPNSPSSNGPIYTLSTPASTVPAPFGAAPYDPSSDAVLPGLNSTAEAVPMPHSAALAPSTQLNHKELANYWSEYFSLQLDWDHLSGLS